MNSKGLVIGIILVIAGVASFAVYDRFVKPELDAKAIVSESKLIIERGDRDSYNLAINTLRKVLVSYSDTKAAPEAYFITGQAYEKLGLYRLAYLKYSYLFRNPLAKNTPKGIREQALISMNKIRILRNHNEEGMHNLYTMLGNTQNPELRSRVYSELGSAYLKKGDSRKALSSFDIALQENNSNEEAIIGKARAYRKAGLYEQTFQMYDYFLKYYGKVSPYASDILKAYRTELYGVALAAFRSGNYRSSAFHMANFLSRFGGDKLSENALYWTGESYFAMKQFDSANAYFDKVLSNNYYHKDEDARIKKGYAFFLSKKFELAAREFQAYLKNYPHGRHADEARRWKDMSASEIRLKLERFKSPESTEGEDIIEEEKPVEPAPVKPTPKPKRVEPEKDSGRTETPSDPGNTNTKDRDDDDRGNIFSNEEVSGYGEIEIDNIAEM